MERAISCGQVLLVHDVEHHDETLNHVLKRELKKSSTKESAILQNTQESSIPVSPSFNVMLLTRDCMPNVAAKIIPYLNVVDFKLTPSVIRSLCQCLILLEENPTLPKKGQNSLWRGVYTDWSCYTLTLL